MLQIKKATKEQIELRAAITGPTGAGKTYTALRMAFAIVGKDGKIVVIDTERESARKYADEAPDAFKWEYDVIELPDFSPSTYTEAIGLGIKEKYDLIIIDSLSHAWEGEGGILELQQKYGGRYQDWAKVNPLHFGLIDTILNSPTHMIVTMRSKMDYAMETVEDAKGNRSTEVKKLGMAPIQRSGVQYEFDFILDMDTHNVGRVDKTRCSSMRGKSAAMPGPAFFTPLVDWLNSGEPVIPKVKYPGIMLNKKTQDTLIRVLKEQQIDQPEKYIQQIFGEAYTLADMTDITARNLVELTKRTHMYHAGILTNIELGYDASMATATVTAALQKECMNKSLAGERWADAETLLTVDEPIVEHIQD